VSEDERTAVLQGTLDLLILRTLSAGPQHGHGIVQTILTRSQNVLLVDHGSMYPALQRLEGRRWIRAEWGVSSNNRRARFYSLTARGRRELEREVRDWRIVATAIERLLAPEPLAE